MQKTKKNVNHSINDKYPRQDRKRKNVIEKKTERFLKMGVNINDD